VTVLVPIIAILVALVAVEWALRSQRRASELQTALGRLADALSTDDREQLVAVVLDTARAMTGADAAVLWSDTGAAVVARMVRGDPVVAVGDRGGPTNATMCVSLVVRKREYGTVALYGGDDSRLGEVRTLAQQASDAIGATYAHDEARRMSITDGLTGLWNRRQFDVRCVEELDRSARFGERFSLVLCDIDDFKAVNDTYGHLVGDAVLVEVARRLVESTRGVDLVARYGGEEFGLVLPQTSQEGALRVADHVREVVGATPVPTTAGDLVVTISVGVATHPEHGTSIPALTMAADAGLYAAKAAGKNQVCPAPDPTEIS
jgi:diguanylate cyclase (GGDEF)-like protein